MNTKEPQNCRRVLNATLAIRRSIERAAILVCPLALLLLSTPALADGGGDRNCLMVTLTGTAGPVPDAPRAKAGTLVRYGQESNGCSSVIMQFDAGAGTLTRFDRLDFDVTSIDAYFITHYHHDHVAEFPTLFQENWAVSLLRNVAAGVIPPIIRQPVVYVPNDSDNGAANFVAASAELFEDERLARTSTLPFPSVPPFITLHEINPDTQVLTPGVPVAIMNDGLPTDVTVVAFENTHLLAEGRQAFSYRIDTPAGDVTVTGDWPGSINPDLAAFAADSHIVTDIVVLPPETVGNPLVSSIASRHPAAPDVAAIANSAGVTLTHFVVPTNRSDFLGIPITPLTPCDYVNAVVDAGFDGLILAGNDLDTIKFTEGQSDRLLCRGDSQSCVVLTDDAEQRSFLCRDDATTIEIEKYWGVTREYWESEKPLVNESNESALYGMERPYPVLRDPVLRVIIGYQF